MSVAERWMDVISNNLANAATTAYKKDVMVFNEGLDRLLSNQNSINPLGKLGAGPAEEGIYTVFEAGQISATGNPFDIAMTNEKAMFQVQTEKGTFYTRDGALTQNSDGELVTKFGAKVLDTSGNPIKIPAGRMAISPDGSIEVNGVSVAQMGIYTGTFTKAGGGLFTCPDPVADNSKNSVAQGAIELSNVNAIEEMIAMIKLNRAFEMAQKSAQSEDESTQRLLTILQDR